MPIEERYMSRCFDLARLGAQNVSPNPLVGAVIVHENRIIGEGFHHFYGGAHAEVNAISSVSADDRPRIPNSTLYVSLEPCCHQGLTPPCTDLIIKNQIKHVVISAMDPNPIVSGKGIERLRSRGVSVTTGILAKEGHQLLSYFRNAMMHQRPYIILKFAQSGDWYIGNPDHQVWLSNDFTKVLVHKLRSEIDGIMVGTNTVVVDNPKLTNREYFGDSPVRITFDRNLRIPRSHYILDGTVPTLVYTESRTLKSDELLMNSGPLEDVAEKELTEYIPTKFDDDMLQNCLVDLGRRQIQSVLVEGGASLINSFVKQNLWDEAWVVTTNHKLKAGTKAPLLHGHLLQKFHLDEDEVRIIRRL